MKSLEDYDIRDVAEYLRDWGYVVTAPADAGDGLWVSQEQLADIENLLICGQKEAAQNDLFNLLGKTLNRSMA
jgi:dienelactone hydrolase